MDLQDAFALPYKGHPSRTCSSRLPLLRPDCTYRSPLLRPVAGFCQPCICRMYMCRSWRDSAHWLSRRRAESNTRFTHDSLLKDGRVIFDHVNCLPPRTARRRKKTSLPDTRRLVSSSSPMLKDPSSPYPLANRRQVVRLRIASRSRRSTCCTCTHP